MKNQPKTPPPPEALIDQLRRALELQQAGDLPAARKIDEKAAAENPDNPDVLQMTGIFYNQAEEFMKAAALLKKVVVKKPEDMIARKALGRALYELGKYEEARAHLAFTSALDDPEANGLLGLTLHKMNELNGAENLYRRSLDKRESLDIRKKYAELLLFLDRNREAADILRDIIRREEGDYDAALLYALAVGEQSIESLNMLVALILYAPEREEAKTVFSITLEIGLMPDDLTDQLAEVMLSCLRSRNVNHTDLKTYWVRLIFERPEGQRLLPLLTSEDYESWRAVYDDPQIRAALLQPLFIEGMEKILAAGAAMENLATFARRWHLERIAAGEKPGEAEISFLRSLAAQSFLNEYVFDETPGEKALLAPIRKKIEALKSGEGAIPEILIYAAYYPLSSLANAKNLFTPDAPPALEPTIRMQILEPREEEKIKKTIRRFGTIADKTSQEVQAQYEQNPYPRWQSCNFIRSMFFISIDEAYKKKDRVLIAGCGTGRHVLMCASQYAYPAITAVDLSASSLAYAMRKCREYGYNDVRFMQADILGLGALDEKFDFIESVGVLHHMKDPEAGLKVLAGLLAPQGQIKLGLYSETARKEVVEIRDVIAAKGFKPDLEGIRACRAYIKQAGTFESLQATVDFYATSSCRDLMFHAQETRYDIPGIKKFLDSAGLEFLRFMMPENEMEQYRRAYPGDPAGKNLENWAEFERRNPSFFLGMYQFLARKPWNL